MISLFDLLLYFYLYLKNQDLSRIYPLASKYTIDRICNSNADIFLVQNHLSVQNGQKKFNEPDSFTKFFVKAFLIVEPPVDLVCNRRSTDLLRTRPDDSFEIIEKHQKTNREIALTLEKKMNLPLLFVDNISIVETIQKVTKWLGNIDAI